MRQQQDATAFTTERRGVADRHRRGGARGFPGSDRRVCRTPQHARVATPSPSDAGRAGTGARTPRSHWATASSSARQRAKQGDIFVSEVERLIRARAQTVFAGPEGAQDRAAIQDEQSERNIAARVNQRYPDGLPLSAVPASVLASLPRLPPELQYRFVRRHLALIDTGARIIVDYILEVLPR